MKALITFLVTSLLCLACWAADTVNVNTASAEEIAQGLKGVGLAKAEAIVRYRDANGKFAHIDELINVKGIGMRTVDINREVLALEGKTVLQTGSDEN